MPPTKFPTPCECDWDCPQHLDLALSQCKDHREVDANGQYIGIEQCYQCTSVVTSCDECQVEEIDEIRNSLALLQGDMDNYETCYSYKQTVISDVSDVNDDIDALILWLQTSDEAKWQAVFTQFYANGLGCQYIPLQYCNAMQKDNAQACQANNNVCDPIEA